jgi:hypothetical protein
MPAVTFSELRDRARSAADMHDSDFVSPTEWFRWANLEKYMLDVFVARNGIVLRQNTTTITIGTTTALLPGVYAIPDPLAIVAVYELVNDRYRRLRSADTIDDSLFPPVTPQGPAQRYRVVQGGTGNVDLELFPVPASGVYKVFTIVSTPITQAADPDDPDDVSDQVNYPMGWEERIVLGMARRALAKEESPTTQIDAQMRTIDQHIEESAWDRLFAANQKVRNVDKVERGWYHWQDFPLVPTREYWYFV